MKNDTKNVPQNKKVSTPIILQMEATECGAAALAIILAYYKKFVNLAEVRQACDVSRDGSRAVNILQAARNYGLEAHGVQMDDWESVFELQLPCIVFWEFDHFVVVEGIKNDKIYINDPATGPRILTHEEFSQGFTGVALELTTTVDFKPSGKPLSIFINIKERLSGLKSALNYLVLISLTLIIPGILIPGFSKIFIDDILIKKTPHWFIPLLIGILLTGILRSLCSWLQQIVLLRLQTQLVMRSTMQVFWHILRLPMVFFSQRYVGDIVERLSSNERIAQLLSTDVSSSIVSSITMIFYAIVMLLLSWQLGLIGIFTAILNTILFYFISKKIANMSYRLQQQMGKLKGIEMNGLQVIDTLKASSAEGIFFQRWAGQHARTINSQQKIAVYGAILTLLPKILDSITTVLFLGLGSYLVIQGHLTLGGLVAMQSLMLSFESPLSNLLSIGTELAAIRGDLLRLEDVLNYPEDSRFKKTATATNTSKLCGELHIKNISFGYSRLEPPVIKNFSLILKPKQSVALVGLTGSGKSTIAKLVASLYQPWSGTIDYANKSLNDLTPEEFAQSIAFVDQDIFLFSGSVQENLMLWDNTIPDNDMERAMHEAFIADIITARGGLQTKIMERGLNFSGGQRQRLEIARALVKKPSLLILDEAMSALDTAIEDNIINKLTSCGYSVIYITHRVHAIQHCDHIIVIEEGEITQQGKHDVLIQQPGLYQALFNNA